MLPTLLDNAPSGFHVWAVGIVIAPILSVLLAYFYYVPNSIKVECTIPQDAHRS